MITFSTYSIHDSMERVFEPDIRIYEGSLHAQSITVIQIEEVNP